MTNKHVLACLVACVALLNSVFALYEFEVHRLVAFEQDGKQFGSKINSFSLVGTHFSGDLLRKLALIQLAEVNNETIDNILNKKPSGLLIILPKGSINKDESQSWKTISENFSLTIRYSCTN